MFSNDLGHEMWSFATRQHLGACIADQPYTTKQTCIDVCIELDLNNITTYMNNKHDQHKNDLTASNRNSIYIS